MFGHPVAHLAVNALRVRKEAEGGSGERADDGVRDGFACRDDEKPSHVVGAVTVLGPRFGVVGVFEGASLVGHRGDVGEARRGGSGHAVTAIGATTCSARSA